MKRPVIPCGCCGGEGSHLLSVPYWETLKDIMYAGEEGITSAELVAKAASRQQEVSIQAMSNRCRYLVQNGFAEREAIGQASGGKEYRYTVKEWEG